MPDWNLLGDEAVEICQAYLRINTTNPPGEERPAADLLAGLLTSAGLEAHIFESEPGRASLVARLPGRRGEPARALGLLHHLDVVPADPTEWSVDPFGGEIRDGYLWGRGAIDMKGMGVMQLMAVLALARERTPLERDVVFVAVADEEAGGTKGAGWLTEHHPGLVSCSDVINEGGYGLKDLDPPIMACALSEKGVVWTRLHAHGTPGHASMPPDDRAINKLLDALADLTARPPALRVTPLVGRTLAAMAAKASPERKRAIERLLRPEAARFLPFVARGMKRYQRALFADVISVTELHAGYKSNVVPSSATATVDCRLLPETDPDEFIAGLRERMARFDVEVEVFFREGPGGAGGSGISDGPLYPLMQQVCEEAFPDVAFAPVICPAFTDSRYFRELGADAYGLVPVMLDDAEVATFHGIDERIPIAGLKRGCEVVYEIVRRACAGSGPRP